MITRAFIAAALVANPVDAGMMMCSMEMKTCPDGSMVSRDSSNNCAFRPCGRMQVGVEVDVLVQAPISPIQTFLPPPEIKKDCSTCPEGYNDGCNDCKCFGGKDNIGACTKKLCFAPTKPYCQNDGPPPATAAPFPLDTLPPREAPTRGPEASQDIDCNVCPLGFYDGCNNCRCMNSPNGPIAACTRMMCFNKGVAKCNEPEPVCPMDMRTCPDGKMVSRDPANNCEFRRCPLMPGPPPTSCDAYGDDCLACLANGCAMMEGPGCMDMCPMDVSCWTGGRDVKKTCAARDEKVKKASICRGSDGCSSCLENGCNWAHMSYDGQSVDGESFCTDECQGMMPCKYAKECPVVDPEPTSPPVMCTMDMRTCPDGKMVSRDPANNCQFPRCSSPPTKLDCKTCPSGFFDGCNQCKCTAGGFAACTRKACKEMGEAACNKPSTTVEVETEVKAGVTTGKKNKKKGGKSGGSTKKGKKAGKTKQGKKTGTKKNKKRGGK